MADPTRIQLPSGGWAEICDPALVPERFVRPLRNSLLGLSADTKAAMASAQGNDTKLAEIIRPEDVAVFTAVNDFAICALVTGWSYPAACRPTVDDILDLPGADYRALQEATAIHVPQLFGVDFSPTPDPGLTPTVPSAT